MALLVPPRRACYRRTPPRDERTRPERHYSAPHRSPAAPPATTHPAPLHRPSAPIKDPPAPPLRSTTAFPTSQHHHPPSPPPRAPATAELPSPQRHSPSQGGHRYPRGSLFLFPLPLPAAVTPSRRSKAVVARYRTLSWPGRPGPPPPELRPGIDLAGPSLPSPSLRSHPRALGRRNRRRRRPTAASPVSQRVGRKKTGHFAHNPLPFPRFNKESLHLLTILQKKPLLLLYFKTDPPTL